jgi:alkylation response protein AidB-like acyl-CoA dehydrogenase
MAKSTAQVLGADDEVPSFTSELIAGRFAWELMARWPVQDPREAAAGDAAVARIRAFLSERVDAESLDASADLPEGLVDDLRKHGCQALAVPEESGGWGLSPYNVFRVVTEAAGRALPVAMTMAIDAAIGVGAYLPALADGPLRDLVLARLAAGVVSGTADTEPAGAANRARQTTATLGADGRYRLNGEKVHIGNAPVADLLWVTATVTEPDGSSRVRVFLVDTAWPGVERGAVHRFLGLRGFANGPVRLTDVAVPAELVYTEEGEYGGRLTARLTVLLSTGRVYLICAPSLAIARQCAHAVREFAARRRIDGRGVGAFAEVQRRVAGILADVFAIEAVAEWALLAGAADGINVLMEQNLAKNIASLACWRAVERATGLLAAEGFETAASKAARGLAQAAPVERLLRDARGLRISGGVDFLLDYWFSQMVVFADHGAPHAQGEPVSDPDPGALNSRNAGHLRTVAAEVRAFGEVCRDLAAAHPDPEAFAELERVHVEIGAIGTELVAMAAVLARAGHLAAAGDESGQHLADVFCVEAEDRLAASRRRLALALASDEPDYAAISDAWLAGADR